MMEVIIAVGLGAWFAVSIGVACIILLKDFKDINKGKDNK